MDPKEVSDLIEKLAFQLASLRGTKGKMTNVARRLDQTIHMALQRAISVTVHLLGTGVDLEAANFRKVERKVDRRRSVRSRPSRTRKFTRWLNTRLLG